MLLLILQNLMVGFTISIIGVIGSRLISKTARKISLKYISEFLVEITSDIKRGLIATGIIYFAASILVLFTSLGFAFIFKNLSTCFAIILCSILITLGSVSKDFLIRYYENNERISEKDRSITLTLIPIVGSIGRYLNVVLTFLAILSIWGVNIAPVLSGTALILAILGFAGQAILQDVLGFGTLLIERPFYVGSDIEFNFEGWSERGDVKEITIRNTVIKNSDGYIFYIPNRDVKNFRVHRR